MGSAKRPELKGPPEVFYSEDIAEKYSKATRYSQIQRELAFRAYELLALPQLDSDSFNMDEDDDSEENALLTPRPCIPSLLLDLGVGSGISASVLNEQNHRWIGIDISRSMLNIAKKVSDTPPSVSSSTEDASLSSSSPSSDNSDTSVEEGVCQNGDFLLGDIGNGVSFRPGSFDGAISISVLQWLCNADTSSTNPHYRLRRLFTSLYSVLRIGARAVFQFYPENSAQVDMILSIALKTGFNGGMIVDFPDIPRRKKYFLVLMAGHFSLPAAKSDVIQTKKKLKKVKNKEWVLRKKEIRRKRGYANVPEDSKYTARKRRPRF